MVANIDTYAPSGDVIVFLLDHENEYVSEPTGANGRFFLEVPLGSPNFLVTNDWAGLDRDTPSGSSVKDDWLTFINVDPMVPVLDRDMEFLIHGCPTEGSPKTWLGGRDSTGAPNGLGSAAIWMNFLKNSEMASDYTDATDLSGQIMAFFHAGTPGNEELGFVEYQITGVSVGVAEASFGVVGYWSDPDVFNWYDYPGIPDGVVQNAALGPDIFVPDAIASGPGHSLTTIFGRTTYSADTITLTFADTRPERSIDFSQVSPLTVPVRKAATTFIVMGSVDNQVTPLLDGMCAANWSPLPCGGAGAPGMRAHPGSLRP